MRIIFCDIDGVLIPGSMFFVDNNAAFKRVFSPQAIAILVNLAIRVDAKIVTNTSHNYMESDGYPLLRDSLRLAGVPFELFHGNWRTGYGSTDWGNRYDSINEWIAGNLGNGEECDWVCFDDFRFTASTDRLIVPKYDVGLGPAEYFKALDVFGIEHNNLIV